MVTTRVTIDSRNLAGNCDQDESLACVQSFKAGTINKSISYHNPIVLHGSASFSKSFFVIIDVIKRSSCRCSSC